MGETALYCARWIRCSLAAVMTIDELSDKYHSRHPGQRTYPMKLKSLILVACLIAAFGTEATAKPSLREQISNPKHLQEALGPKAYVLTDVRGKVSRELQLAIKSARLDESVQFAALPPEAEPAEPTQRRPPAYPVELRRAGVSGHARFLFLIETDGTVKSIYCYDTSRPGFALAGAEAVKQWRFSPARIGDTPVAMVASQTLEFNTN
jgi:hypothetical protein